MDTNPTGSSSMHRVNTLKQHLRSDLERRVFAQETCMLTVTMALVRALESKGITRTALAERIERTPGFVSQVLNGSRNMTLKTMADILWACGLQLHDLETCPIGESRIPKTKMNDWLDSEPRPIMATTSAAMHGLGPAGDAERSCARMSPRDATAVGPSIAQVFLKSAQFDHRADFLSLPPATRVDVGEITIEISFVSGAGGRSSESAGRPFLGVTMRAATRETEPPMLYSFAVEVVALVAS
jgi:hypothetical protein